MTEQQRLYSEDCGVWYYPLNWVKRDSYYSAPIQADDQDLINHKKCYHVTVEKISSGKWVIFSEDHNPEDFEQSVFETLKAAKAYLQEWVLSWVWCETMGIDDPEFNSY